MSKAATLHLGASARIDRTGGLAPCELPAHHLVTHAFCAGQTGSGKTGFNLVLVEEGAAVRTNLPFDPTSQVGEDKLTTETISQLCARIGQRANKQPGVSLAAAVTVGEAVCRDSASGVVEVVGGPLLELDTWTGRHRFGVE